MKKLNQYYYMIIAITLFVYGYCFQIIIPRRYAFILTIILLVVEAVVRIKLDNISIKDIKNNIWNLFGIREISLLLGMSFYNIARYFYYDNRANINGPIIWALMPLIFQELSMAFLYKNKRDTYKIMQLLLLSLASGFMMQNLIAIGSYYTVVHDYSEPLDYRFWVSYGFGQKEPATYYEFYPMIFAVLLVWAIYTVREKMALKLIIIITGLGSTIWFVLFPDSKTVMLAVLITVIIDVCIILLDRINNNQNKDKIIKLAKGLGISLIAVIIIYAFVYFNNIFGYKDWYSQSMFSRSGGVFNNVRVRMSINAILQLRDYPLGNNHTIYYNKYDGTHVSWTNVAYCAGIIPFVLLMIYLFFTFKDIINLIKSRTIELKVKLFLVSAFMGVFLYSCIEPLIEMFAWYTVMFVGGMIRATVLNDKLLKED